MAVILPSNPAPLDEYTNDVTGAKYYYDDGRVAWIFKGGLSYSGDGTPPDYVPPGGGDNGAAPGEGDYPVYISALPPQSIDERKFYKFWCEMPRYELYVHVLDEDEGIDMYVSVTRNGDFRFVSNVGDQPPLEPSMGNVLGNEDGNLWFDSVSCKLYMRWNDQWIALSTNDYVSPSDREGYEYKIDDNVQEMKNTNAYLYGRIENLKSMITNKFAHVFEAEVAEEEEEVFTYPEETLEGSVRYEGVDLNSGTSILNRYSSNVYRSSEQ